MCDAESEGAKEAPRSGLHSHLGLEPLLSKTVSCIFVIAHISKSPFSRLSLASALVNLFPFSRSNDRTAAAHLVFMVLPKGW